MFLAVFTDFVLLIGTGLHLMGIKLNAAYLIGSKESPMANTIAVGLGYTF